MVLIRTEKTVSAIQIETATNTTATNTTTVFMNSSCFVGQVTFCNSALDSFMNPVTFPTVLISLVEAVSGTVIISHPCYQETLKSGIIWFLYGLMAPSDTDEVSYFELGTIRVSTSKSDSEEGGAIMVLSPWLAYPAGDTVFFEELSRKSGSIKGTFQAYFSSRTKNQLLTETEEKIVQVLIEEINADLALGKVSGIYFTDYLFLE